MEPLPAPRVICPTRTHWQPYDARIAGRLDTAYRCAQGVPDVPRLRCRVYCREAGADERED